MSSMVFDVQSGGGVPAGVYRVRFLGVTPTQHDEFGLGARFDFEVLDGEHKGEATTRITSPSPTPRNACGRMIAGLTGRAVEPGQRVDLAPYVGLDYLAQVELAASGTATRVATIMPGTWAQVAPAPPSPRGVSSPPQTKPSPSPAPAGVLVSAPASPAMGPTSPPEPAAENVVDLWERF